VTTGLCTHRASAQTAAVQNSTAIRGNVSAAQRALNSRAQLLNRANVQGRGQTDTRANTNAVNARADIAIRANVNANANINATSTESRGQGRGTLLAPAAALRLPQAAIRQRLETPVRGEIGARIRGDVQTRLGDARDRRSHPKQERERNRPERARPEIMQTRAEVLSQTQVQTNASPAQRLLIRRLAQIDKMRDTALANGNERQLEQADRMEQLARWQFENRFAARANNPFAEVDAQSMTEGTLESDPVRHPFRPAPRPVPGNRFGTTRIQTETETEFGSPTPVEFQN
ncbi:MAG: hypothetical protein KDA84_07745, partial [Planctomycetaceae bacterium]|nr:hypothetical protein [Planctomycetaceae bacterium]